MDDWKKDVTDVILAHPESTKYTQHYDEMLKMGMVSGLMSQKAKDVFDDLQHSFNEVVNIPKGVTLYRGTSGIFNVGDTMEYKYLTSFTATRRVAERFSSMAKNKKDSAIISLTINSDHKVLYFSSRYGTSYIDMDEDEYLFNCGMSFIVIAIDSTRSTPTIYVDLLPELGDIPNFLVDRRIDRGFETFLSDATSNDHILLFKHESMGEVYIWSRLFEYLDEDFIRVGDSQDIEDQSDAMYRDYVVGKISLFDYTAPGLDNASYIINSDDEKMSTDDPECPDFVAGGNIVSFVDKDGQIIPLVRTIGVYMGYPSANVVE